jgi:hypothetical protein
MLQRMQSYEKSVPTGCSTGKNREDQRQLEHQNLTHIACTNTFDCPNGSENDKGRNTERPRGEKTTRTKKTPGLFADHTIPIKSLCPYTRAKTSLRNNRRL